jgi:hypothetical protein
MINTVNYMLPIFGLLSCFYVMLTRKINTKDPIRIAKLNLYTVGWVFLLWADWVNGFTPVFATVVFRLIIFTINLLYIKSITVSMPVQAHRLWAPTFRN